jgi:hypothetical protein
MCTLFFSVIFVQSIFCSNKYLVSCAGVMLEMRGDMHVNLHVKCSFSFDQNWKYVNRFKKTFEYKIS